MTALVGRRGHGGRRPPAGRGHAITEQLSTASIDNIVVTPTDGRPIVWGNASQSAEKAALLPVLLAQPGNVYDISVPSHPAIR